jgi:uncharacterized caspase-like protein
MAGGDQAGNHADAEEDDRRYEVNEARQRLHKIEHRPEQAVQPWPMRRGDADRHADDHADQCG